MTLVADAGFAVRTPLWQGAGIVIPEAVKAADAIRLGGLDWTVEKERLCLPDGTETQFYATVRSSDRLPLGVVQKDYVPFNNVEAFDFADALVDSGDLVYETVGPLRNGRWVWLLARMPGEILVGGEDPVQKYLLLFNSHDGTRAITVVLTSVRVICQNTLMAALKGAKNRWTVRHLGNMDGKLQEARRALDISFRYFGEFEAQANEMVDTAFSESDFEAFLDKLLPTPVDGKDPNATWREGILTNYETSVTLNGIRETRWGALQAVSEYGEHVRQYRTSNAQVMNNFMGDASRINERALKLLVPA